MILVKTARHIAFMRQKHLIAAAALFGLAVFALPAATPLGAAFTYQGRLQQSETPANGLADFRCTLWDAVLGGLQVGTTQTSSNVVVTNGLFNLTLDFGPEAFAGAARWLELAVSMPAGAENWATLSPRQAVLAAPSALYAARVAATNLMGPLADSQIPPSVARLSLGQVFSGSNLFTGSNYFSGPTLLANASGEFNGVFRGAFVGDGAGLTNLSIGGGSSNQLMQWSLVPASMTALANRGYLAGNATQVTLTLPASPIPGDVVRVAGANAGGWKILQGSGKHTILTPPLGCAGGLNWTSNGPPARWRSIASSADGLKLVAVATGPGYIHISSNGGKTWVTNTTLHIQWEGVASSADGLRLIAGGSTSGDIYTSNDGGLSWTNHNGVQMWSAFASSADGVKLVGVVGSVETDTRGYIWTSGDSGNTWNPHASSNNWTCVACSADGTRMVAGTLYGVLYTSVNSGTSWTQHGPTNYWRGVASSADGRRLAAVARGESGNGRIFLSDDYGLTWTAQGPSKYWTAVASSADGSRIFAAESGGGAGGQIWVSIDSGRSWSAYGPSQSWVSIAAAADGSRVAAAVSSGGTSGPIYTSGQTTAQGLAGGLVGDADAAVELLYIGNSQFRVLSHEGTINAF